MIKKFNEYNESLLFGDEQLADGDEYWPVTDEYMEIFEELYAEHGQGNNFEKESFIAGCEAICSKMNSRFDGVELLGLISE